MGTIIIMALTLALFQIWIIPMTGALVINIKSMSYLLSNRDREITIDPTSVSARILRASSNLQESLPAFLALAILSIITDVDNTMYAMTWVFLRFLFLFINNFLFNNNFFYNFRHDTHPIPDFNPL